MKTIVIATKNQDKYTLVKNLLSDLGLTDWNYKILSDYNISSQAEETGTAEDRASQKAHFFVENCPEGRDVDVVVGIDDGMMLKGSNGVITDSKGVTQEVLSWDETKVGEEVINHRAFSFLFLKTNQELIASTEIKFNYLGNLSGVKLEEGKYPLSHVLGYEGYKVTVADMNPEEVRKLNVKFSETALQPVVLEINILFFA